MAVILMLELDNEYVAVHSVLPTFLCALDCTAMYFTNMINKPDYYHYKTVVLLTYMNLS